MSEMKTQGERQIRTSAVFVDFDNVFLGLNSIDPESARKFAENPGDWMAKFVEGEDEEGKYQRRFLVRACYLNPAKFSPYRAYFTRAGFKVVDCPSLTQQGKSGTDIHLVLDAIDALGASTRYDEFVIMSADADFTPLAMRCRADDRRVTVVTAGFSASAYRAVADTVIGGEQLISLVDGDDELLGEALETAAGTANPSTETSDHDSISRAVAAITEKVAASTSPLPLATAAHVAGQSAPSLLASEWEGMGFANWLRAHAPDLEVSTLANPGFVWNPSRHSAADLPSIPTRQMDPLQEQIIRVTEIPGISQEEYRVLLEQLHSDVSMELFHRTHTSKRVRDVCDELGSPISRRAINFVITSLLYSELDLDSDISLETLVESWVSNALALCQGARMDLSTDDITAIRTWLSGGLLGGPESGKVTPVGA
ncbi:NYN domain-containing protein [Myceligenerans halotolerans]